MDKDSTLKEQVNLDDAVWNASERVDGFETPESETPCFGESNPVRTIKFDCVPETYNSNGAKRAAECPAFDTATDKCTDINEQSEDEILPAIQIYKTFSLATYGKSPFSEDDCPEIPDHTTAAHQCQQDSYLLTNLDHTELSNDTHWSETKPQRGRVKQEPVPYSKNRSVSSESVGCHVIDLESFSPTRPISPLKIKLEDVYTGTPCVSKKQSATGPSFHNSLKSETGQSNNFLLPKAKDIFDDHFYETTDLASGTRHGDFLTPPTGSYFYDSHSCETEMIKSEHRGRDRPSYKTQKGYCGAKHIYTLGESLICTHGQDDRELSSFDLTVDDAEYSTCASDGFEQLVVDTTDSPVTSNLVVDLNERMPDDSGVFEESLAKHMDYADKCKQQQQPRSSSLQEYHRHPGYTYETVDKGGTWKSDAGGLWYNTEGLPDTYNRRVSDRMRRFQISCGALSESARDVAYYNEVMTLKDPYMMDGCGGGYYYPQDFDQPFCCQRDVPYGALTEWSPRRHRNTAAIADLAHDSLSSAGFSDHFADIFEADDTPGIGSCLQVSGAVKDEEETDDADEIAIMPEMTGTSCNYFSEKQDRLSSYLHTSQSTPAPLTPPSSASSTPNPPGSHIKEEGDGTLQLGNHLTPGMSSFMSTCPSSETSTALTPLHQPFNHLAHSSGYSASDYLDPSLLTYGLQRGYARPFPSMADAIQTDYAYSQTLPDRGEKWSKSVDLTTTTRRRGKPKKVQIQSDKISTSTAKSCLAGARGVSADQAESCATLCDINIKPGGGTAGKLERTGKSSKAQWKEAKSGGPRHNEPLKQRAVDVMTRWYEQHIDDPYPTKAQKAAMAREGEISENQVKSWFANKRNRTHNTKPKVQKRAMEEKLKELFKDLKNTPSATATDNTHIIQQLSGIIQHCHMKLE